MKTVNEMLAEKNINEQFLLTTVESLAVIFRSNTFTRGFMPESLQVTEIDSDESFRSTVELLTSNRKIALTSIVVGVDSLAKFLFENMQSGDYSSMDEQSINMLLNEMTEQQMVMGIVGGVSSVMAMLEKRMEDKSSRYDKLDWGFNVISERAKALAIETYQKLEDLTKQDADIKLDDIQVMVTALTPAIMTIMNIHAILEVADLLKSPPSFIEEISGGASASALQDVLMQTNVAIVREKIAINFGDEFLQQIEAMAEKNGEDITIH